MPFEELLENIGFDPARDQLWLTGDLVNRGPKSLETLRLVKKLGQSVITVLGNHDLHFLAVAKKIRRSRAGDTFKQIRKAPDLDELTYWLRNQPLVHWDKKLKVIMTHAGVYPGWSRKQLIKNAQEVEKILRGDDFRELLRNMYGNTPRRWEDSLTGWKRSRFILNALTRMRYCDSRARLDFDIKGPPGKAHEKYMPWYKHPMMKCKKWRIVFGHWSSLGYMQRKNIISLDSGCVWGEKLTAVQLDAKYVAPCWQLNC